MNRFLKGMIFLVLGFVMLAWFGFSIVNPPTRPSETYPMDWVLIFVRLVGAIAFLLGGILSFFERK